MNIDFISYLPLALMLAFFAFCGFLIWRGEYKIGAYIVQVSAAAFLSSIGGMGLYVISVVMVTTWLFAGYTLTLAIGTVLTQAIGATAGFALVKRFGTYENRVTLNEVLISLVLAIIGAAVGFVLLKDATFGADFVTNASSVAGAYFGAVLMANIPLIVMGLIRVLRNHEP